MPELKATRWARYFVPVLVGGSLIGAFYAGEFVGSYDEHKKNELIAKRVEMHLGVDEVKRLGAVADLLRRERTSDAERVLNFYVKIKAKAVVKCLADPLCTALEMESKQEQAKVQNYLAAAGADQ